MKPLSFAGRHFGLSSQSLSSANQSGSDSPPAPAAAKSKKRQPKKQKSTIVISDVDEDGDDIADPEVEVTRSARTGKGKAKGVECEEQSLASEIWSDCYGPSDLTDLSVHKKKVSDVRGWLTEALENPKLAKYRRLLVLSGPAGTAKTTTIRLLCQDMGVDISEFRSGQEGGADSLTQQFQAFVSSSANRPALQMGQLGAPALTEQLIQDTIPASPAGKKLILVEDLPNVFTSSQTRDAFRASLSHFVFDLASSRAVHVPMVLIISDAVVTAGGEDGWQANSWSSSTQDEAVSVRNLVPLDVLRGGRCTEIRFNPVAPTIMQKGLSRVFDKAREGPHKKRKSPIQRPSADVLKLIAQASNGDIRSAVNMLQFLSQRSDSSVGSDASAAGKKKRKRGRAEDANDPSLNPALSALLTGRESSIFLFHALGKVLYSKRWGEFPDDDAKDTRCKPPPSLPLPLHLRQEWDRRPSKVDANELFADAPVDTDMFTAYMHQNYTAYTTDIDQCVNATEYYSASDTMSCLDGDKSNRNPAMPQYSFQTSVRGLLMSLPSPVPRKGQKMFKADMWDRNRKMRENHQALASIATAYGQTFKPLSSFITVDERRREQESSASLTRPTQRLLSRDLVPYFKLVSPTTLNSFLPPYAVTLAQSLSYVALESRTTTSGLLDEHEVDEIEESTSAAPSQHSPPRDAEFSALELPAIVEDEDDEILDSD